MSLLRKRNMAKDKKWNRVILWLMLLGTVYIMALSAYNLWGIYQMYAEGDRTYEKIISEVRPSDAVAPVVSPPPTNTETAEPEPALEIPPLGINYAQLTQVNADAAGWLYCPGTAIDYPVMKASDYEWYLRHLPDGTYNLSGSLFLEYHCAQDFSGQLSIIYGHNMKNGKMFSALTDYKEQEYFERHPYLYLYTQQGNYRIDLIYGCLVGAGEWSERNFMLEGSLPLLLDYAAGSTTFESGEEYSIDSDRFIALSTCSYEFNDARYVVIGVLKPECP